MMPQNQLLREDGLSQKGLVILGIRGSSHQFSLPSYFPVRSFLFKLQLIGIWGVF